MRKKLSKVYGLFLSFCLKNRLGKTRRGAQTIFFITKILSRFNYYKNNYEGKARGHYVPQFILKEFRITDDQSKLGLLYSFSIQTKKITEKNAKDVAQEPDFYIFKDKKGNKSDYAEKQLYGNLENSMSRVVKYILKINKTENFTFLESSIIAVFLAHQITRTPAFYANLEKFISFLISQKGLDFKKELFIGDHKFNSKAIEKIIVNNSFNISQEDLNEYDQKITIAGESIIPVLRLFTHMIANNIAKDIHQKNIYILDTSNTDYKFVISDNPVVLFENCKGGWNFPAWWDISNKNLFLALPLNPYKAVILNSSVRKDEKRFLNDEQAQFVFSEMINVYQFGKFSKEVFSGEKDYLEKKVKYYSEVIGKPFENFDITDDNDL